MYFDTPKVIFMSDDVIKKISPPFARLKKKKRKKKKKQDSETAFIFTTLKIPIIECTIMKCDVTKFSFLNFSIFMTISVEHDEKPLHTKKFYMSQAILH